MNKRLSVKYQGKTLPEMAAEIPSNGIITVGNDISATIQLQGENIAPEQFVLVCEPEQVILMSRVDGISINDTPTSQGNIHNLQNTDVIKVKDYVFFLENDEEFTDEVVAHSLPLFSETTKEESGEIHESKSERTLTDVLKSLRSEEKFYFQIETSKAENQRLFIENDESFLGKNADESFVLAVETNEVETIYAQVRKDWSGVLIQPISNGQILLGDKVLAEPHRLKNDERIFLISEENQKPDLETVIKFHEPTALLVLDSILPKELPTPISLEENETIEIETVTDEIDLTTNQTALRPQTTLKRLYFGYFTLTEIIIMIIGTLITAAIIFLILELY